MATIKAVKRGTTKLGKIIDYVSRENKTQGLITGINCNADTAFEEMQATKELYGKTNGRQYKHYVLSYHRDENITAEQAYEIALELAKEYSKWEGYEILVATHTDKDHIHTHFIINSVNMATGRKYHENPNELQQLKDTSDTIQRDHGLTVCEKGKTFEGNDRTEPTSYDKYEYRALQHDNNVVDRLLDEGRSLEQAGKLTESYKYNVALQVELAKAEATSRAEFVDLLEKQNISVRWEEKRKNISFIDNTHLRKDGKPWKFNDDTLSKNCKVDINKEVLEYGFEQNKQQQHQQQQSDIRTAKYLAESAERSYNTIADERYYYKSVARPVQQHADDNKTAREQADRASRTNRIIEQRSREATETRREPETARSNEQRAIKQNQGIRTTVTDAENAKRNFAKYYYNNNR